MSKLQVGYSYKPKQVLVNVEWPCDKKMNPCSEIALPQQIPESEIPLLILNGADVKIIKTD